MPEPSAPFTAEFDACSADAETLVRALTDEQGRWRPAPGRWSVAECLAHLAATARAYQPALDAAVASARARGRSASAPFRLGWFGRRIAAGMEPTTRRRLRAPASIAPPADVSLVDAWRAFTDAQAGLRATAAAAAGVDLRAAKVRSPVAPLLRLSLGTALAALAAHERRHLAQARRVVDDPAFPRG